MFHSLPNPEPDFDAGERRNPWAFIDLVVFGIFFVAILALISPFASLPVIYAIPLQGVFNLTLVGFIAAWVRIIRRSSFIEYIHFHRSHTFSTRSLILLGAISALSVLLVSAFLPSTGETPLEKLLTSKTAIMMFAIFGVAVAPLLEEIIFRGFLFKVLWEIGGSRVAVSITSALFAVGGGAMLRNLGIVWTLFWAAFIFLAASVVWQIVGPRAAIVITAAMFALLHAGQLAGNWGSVGLIFIVGCVLSVVRYRSNSIIPSFIVHTSYNAVLFLLFAVSSAFQKIAK